MDSDDHFPREVKVEIKSPDRSVQEEEFEADNHHHSGMSSNKGPVPGLHQTGSNSEPHYPLYHPPYPPPPYLVPGYPPHKIHKSESQPSANNQSLPGSSTSPSIVPAPSIPPPNHPGRASPYTTEPPYYSPYPPYYPPPPPVPYGYPVYYHPHHHPPPPPYHYGIPSVSGDMTIEEESREKEENELNDTNEFKDINMSIQPSQSEETTEDNRYEKRKKEAEFKIKMKLIEKKKEEEKTEEELRLYSSFEQRRKRKNERSRERTKENKAKMNFLMAIPEDERTPEQNKWLTTHLKAKKRKNMKDRERRRRIKMMKSANNSSVTPNEFLPHDLSLCSTFTSQESNTDSLEPVDSFVSSEDPSEIPIEGDEGLCPKLFLHLASVIESPDSPGHTSHEPNHSRHHQQHPLMGVHNNNATNDLNFDTILEEPTSPIRMPQGKSRSRSSIFRLKPNT